MYIWQFVTYPPMEKVVQKQNLFLNSNDVLNIFVDGCMFIIYVYSPISLTLPVDLTW